MAAEPLSARWRSRVAHQAAAVVSADAEEVRLVAAARAGDSAAFSQLYDRHIDRVYRQCYYRTGNRADAEDLTQQTFLQAWQALPRFRCTGAPFVAWLLTISHHLAVSFHRKGHELPVGDDWGAFEEAADGPEAAVLSRLGFADVRQALLALKPERQQVVLLRFLEGFSVDEIAEVLGKSANNVRVIQHRALEDLRRALAAAGRPESR